MKKLTPAVLTTLGLLLMAASLVACDDQCDIAAEADQVGYRNPETGVCQAVGGGTGGNGCGDFGIVEGDREAPGAQPDMAICYGGCEGLDEITCVATDFCRAIIVDGAYADCWGTAPSGPTPGVDCEGLDAYSCSRTDHCSAVHDDAGGFAGDFLACTDERVPCTSDTDCASGSCSASTECLAGPGCSNGPCADVCWGFCDGGGSEVGSCVGEPACDLPEPECPAGTIAGRTEDCWTNYCIPIDQCDVTPACASLDEVDCNASGECAALYRGEDCACDAGGCSCTTYTYEGCGSNQP